MIDLRTRQDGAAIVVSIIGSLDALTAPQLAQVFRQQFAENHYHLVGDLSELEYTSSAGLRVLLSASKESRQHGGDLRLAAVRPKVMNVLDLSGFTSILKFFPDVASAVASINV
jgi:anti-sigma B factor antagonist